MDSLHRFAVGAATDPRGHKRRGGHGQDKRRDHALAPATGTITPDHEANPEAKWPPMVMGFKIDPAKLKGLAVGDKVAFVLATQQGAGAVTAIAKR
ncbi:MAG TPA: copper-binding protein [Caulobacter sp.]|nr:copper-binding protein [Caulobacter sp.]